jgi:hypothetical protein
VQDWLRRALLAARVRLPSGLLAPHSRTILSMIGPLAGAYWLRSESIIATACSDLPRRHFGSRKTAGADPRRSRRTQEKGVGEIHDHEFLQAPKSIDNPQ